MIGRRFNGLDTDWCHTETDIQNTIDMVTNWPCALTELTDLLTNPDHMHSLRLTKGKLDQNRKLIEELVHSLGRQFPNTIPPSQMVETSAVAVRALEKVSTVLKSLRPQLQVETVKLVDLQSFVYTAIRLTRVNGNSKPKLHLTELFSQSFRGTETNWTELENKLSWAKSALDTWV